MCRTRITGAARNDVPNMEKVLTMIIAIAIGALALASCSCYLYLKSKKKGA
jgi:hypothetical protein